ncbi:MAG TPA: SUF system NifU family Fe-S cluster assembly protein [Planctomycetota bacterium]|nr:SUF system NifU family Fe-S cluster assembly protein [Planctomycetota bacterium]
MADPRTLYERTVLDHARAPRNLRAISPCDRHAEGRNPLCGDELKTYLAVADGTISDAAFEARGCAVSIAAASVLSEAIRGKSEAEAQAIVRAFASRLRGDVATSSETTSPELDAFAALKDFPSRVRCATLSAETFLAALEKRSELVTTE